MFNLLAKTLDVAFDPLWWCATLVVVGLLLRRRRPRAGLALLALGPALVVLLALPPVANRLWHALEDDAPRSYVPEKTYDVVVLLGGVIDAGGSNATEAAWGNNVERFLTTYDLLRTGKAKAAIITGGVPSIPAPEARVLGDQLAAWGIERERLLLDEKAVNTRENAQFSAKLVREHGFTSVLLVTSAFHMKRSVAAFKAAGLEVDTLPVDYRMREPSRDRLFLPRTNYLEESARALHEWAGRLVYAVTG